MSIQDEATRIISARDNAFNAVTAKGVTVAQGSNIDDLAGYIMEIETNDGDDVIFIDYDGTELYKYKASVFQSMTELPPNPTHTGLIAQGWNWTLAQIKEQLTDVGGKIVVGQMYATESGATELDVVIPCDNVTPCFMMALNGSGRIDWGDGTIDSVTGSSLSSKIYPYHTYENGGSYTIKFYVDSGKVAFGYNNNRVYKIFVSPTQRNVNNMNVPYSSMIINARIGNNVEFIQCVFNECYNLRTVTLPMEIAQFSNYIFYYCNSLVAVVIPPNVTSIGTNAFEGDRNLKYVSIPFTCKDFGNNSFLSCEWLYCFTLPKGCSLQQGVIQYDNIKYVVIPTGVTSIPANTFRGNRLLQSMSLPDTITGIGQYAFESCSSLNEINIPNGVTAISTKAFQNDYVLKALTLPPNITTISEYLCSACYALSSVNIPHGVTSIGKGAFLNCYMLVSITIPSTVTSIGDMAFGGCQSIKNCHILPTTPPTLNTATVFTSLPSDCIMYVPYSEDHSILELYKTSTNWSAHANRMQEEPQ